MTETTSYTRGGLMTVVARNIRARRLALEISQDELARMVDLCRSSVTNIEAGRQATNVRDLELFAEALYVTPAWLVTEHGR